MSHAPEPSGTGCDDGQACTANDECDGAGACVGTAIPDCFQVAADCDDGNACTIDACQTDGTVTHDPEQVGTPCDDGDECSGSEVCGVEAPAARGSE